MKVKGIVIQGIKAGMSENSTISSLEKYGTYEIMRLYILKQGSTNFFCKERENKYKQTNSVMFLYTYIYGL